MFYSETLLSKTGPLARVWLSANLERNLKKPQVLRENIKDNVEAIVAPNQAPLALRLSGQLLLGVVRIYSRKARYLLDDCNDALTKIKMAFHASGNNDLADGQHMPSRDALMLPDVLTEGDNLELPPMPDATFLLSQMDEDSTSRKRRAGSRDINLQEDYNGSQFLQNSIENNDDLNMEPLDDFDLGLDLGLDLDFGMKDDVEFGRDAPAARGAEDDLLSEMEIQVPEKGYDAGDRDTSLNLGFGDDGVRMGDDDGDVDMFMGDQDVTLPTVPMIRPERISESPLSDIDEALAQEVEAEHERSLLNNTTLYEPEEESEQSIFRNPAQRARKQRLLQPDDQVEFTNTQIKEHQQNRDKILRPQSFLPRDPELLALMEMQKNGGFVSNIMGGGRSVGWAPELQGMLSLEAVRNLKRKRDSGIADMDSEDERGPSKEARLELDEEDEVVPIAVRGASIDEANATVAPDGTIIEMPGDDQLNLDDDHDASAGLGPVSPGPNFDETTAPLVHPADNGPVSLGTKHAVHLLRDRFGADTGKSHDKRTKTSVLFQDLLPETTTSRADATKMFFEILVLATKDAVKVEQTESSLGGPIRVRGKRALWDKWAEDKAGGEIEEEAEAGPSGGLEQVGTVAVAA